MPGPRRYTDDRQRSLHQPCSACKAHCHGESENLENAPVAVPSEEQLPAAPHLAARRIARDAYRSIQVILENEYPARLARQKSLERRIRSEGSRPFARSR